MTRVDTQGFHLPWWDRWYDDESAARRQEIAELGRRAGLSVAAAIKPKPTKTVAAKPYQPNVHIGPKNPSYNPAAGAELEAGADHPIPTPPPTKKAVKPAKHAPKQVPVAKLVEKKPAEKKPTVTSRKQRRHRKHPRYYRYH